MKVKLPNLLRDTDRHGNPRIYYRGKGRRMIRLHAEPGTDAFLDEYKRARDGIVTPAPRPPARSDAGSLRQLIEGYYASANFTTLAASTQRARRGILDDICESQAKNGATRGDLPFLGLQSRHVCDLRDEKVELPEAANGRIKAVRHVFSWAMERDLAKDNPAQGVRFLHGNSEGHHPWTVEEVLIYERHHPIGTQARLALALFTCTGVRRSDVVKLGRHMERDGVLRFTETKGSTSRALGNKRPAAPKQRVLPILPELQEIIDATPSGNMTYLVTAHGRPFTSNGFGNRFRKWCDEAGLHGCAAHGLRKAGAAIAAQNGASPHQLNSIFGWTTLQQAEGYTRSVNQERMASEAMHLLRPRRERNQR